MARPFRIRDPVHNFIELNREERAIVDIPLFQRLRGIRQLAMESLVYPGALHTRFDHSLGVCHVAGRMMSALQDRSLVEPEEVTDVRLAALLHDVGHGPFSHVSEYSLARFAKSEAVPLGFKREKIHELVASNLMEQDERLKRVLSPKQIERVIRILRNDYGRAVVRQAVSGPIDADKQDYLLRDSRFCGVPYGVFDLDQLHRSLRLGGERNEELVIDPGGLHAVEQFALAKYYMFANVYRHKVRLISDQMLVRAVRVGIEMDNLAALRELYEYDGTSTFLLRYRQWDDAKFLHFFADLDTKHRCAALFSRLRERRLLRRVLHRRLTDFSPEGRDLLVDISQQRNDARRAALEAMIARELPALTAGPAVDSWLVILHSYKIPSVRDSVRNDTSGIFVQDKDKPIPFDQESTLFASIDQTKQDQYLDVYAPVDWENHDERAAKLRKIEEPLFKMINAELARTLFGATS